MHQRTIADRYDAFVADTPLCQLDSRVLSEWLPGCPCGSAERVVDLGCGTGRSAMLLAKGGYEVIGIDLSLPMLAAARRNASSDPAIEGSIRFVRANLVELECFADEIADHAVCLFSTLGMIQGNSFRRRVLSHAGRLIRPGGRLVLHVHHRWSALHEVGGLRRLAGSWLQSIAVRNREFGDFTYNYRGIDQMFMHRFSKREISRDLTASGWHISQIRGVSLDGSSLLAAGDPGWRTCGGFLILATKSSELRSPESRSQN